MKQGSQGPIAVGASGAITRLAACVDPPPTLFSSGRFGNLDSPIPGHWSLVFGTPLAFGDW